MKSLIKIVLILFLFSAIYVGQDNSPNSYDKEKKIQLTERTTSMENLISILTSERALTSTVLIIELVVLFFVLFYWQKTRQDKKTGYGNILKQNISAIRNERIKPNIINSEIPVRKSLINKINLSAIKNYKLSSKAKRLSISKGELLLAVRIKQLEHNKL